MASLTDRLDSGSARLAAADPVMATLVARHGPCRLPPRRRSHFEALARTIVYQQLAGAAAATIWGRFQASFNGGPTPEGVLSAPEQQLRAAGLSGTKAAAVRDLAHHVATGLLPTSGLSKLDDEAVLARLVAVRGIGEWTAHMFLIFQLRRLDVWPTADYGVRKGYAAAYGVDLPPPKLLADLGEPFRPQRSVAAWFLWRASEAAGAPERKTHQARRSR